MDIATLPSCGEADELPSLPETSTRFQDAVAETLHVPREMLIWPACP
jgi:hypothetical protein